MQNGPLVDPRGPFPLVRSRLLLGLLRRRLTELAGIDDDGIVALAFGRGLLGVLFGEIELADHAAGLRHVVQSGLDGVDASLTAASVTDRIGVFIETLASDLILRSCSTALPAQASVSGEAPVAAAA